MTRRGLVLIGALALFVRVAFVLIAVRHYAPQSDAANYFGLAASLAHGHGFVGVEPFDFLHATAARPPFYPALVSLLFHVTGTKVGAGQALNVVLGSVSAVLAALVGARLDPRSGLAAGVIVALYPPLIANDVTFLAESLSLVLLLVVVLTLQRGATLAAGLVMGSLVLTRASAQFLPIVLAVWVVFSFGWRHALRFVLATVIVVTPWIMRNWAEVGAPVVVTSNGFNLHAEYSREARVEGRFVDAIVESRFANLRNQYLDEPSFDNELRRRAVAQLRAHPLDPLRVIKGNMRPWFELAPGTNDGPEARDGRVHAVRIWTLPVFYVVTLAGVWGLWLARRRRVTVLLLLIAGYFTLVSLASVAVPRLRAPFDLVMAIGAGVTVASLLGRSLEESPPEDDGRGSTAPRSRALITLALVSVLMIGAGIVWRNHVVSDTARHVHTAIAGGRDAVDDVQRAFPLDVSSGLPTLPQPQSVDRAEKLVAELQAASPKLGSARVRTVAAAVDLRSALRSLKALELLSAREAFDAADQRRPPDAERVMAGYDAARRANPSLIPWDDVIEGATLVRARDELARLEGAAIQRAARIVTSR